MSQPLKAQKVSIYVTEGSTHHGTDAASGILDFLFYRGVSGATVLKGVAGFGGDHHLHTASLVEVSDHLPVKVEFIETPEKVQELLPKLQELCGSGMIELQETTILKAAGAHSPKPQPLPQQRKLEGKAKLLRICIDEADQWSGKPLHQAIVEALLANDIAGVTVYRGILGYGENRTAHEHTMLTHHGSLVLSVVEHEDRIRDFMPALERMMTHGLAVISDVDVISYRHRERAQRSA